MMSASYENAAALFRPQTDKNKRVLCERGGDKKRGKRAQRLPLGARPAGRGWKPDIDTMLVPAVVPAVDGYHSAVPSSSRE